jgi:hypothetical protein
MKDKPVTQPDKRKEEEIRKSWLRRFADGRLKENVKPRETR